jgi:RND family efflux transporter MFP subunit
MKTSHIKTSLHLTLHLTTLLCAVWFMASCSSKQNEQSEQSAKRPDSMRDSMRDSVRVVRVRELLPESAIVLPGDFKPWAQTTIYAKVKGFIKSLAVDRGSVVRRGQVLAVLDAPELTEQLAEAQARLEQARATLNESKAFYARLLQTSKTQGAVAEGEVEAARLKAAADSAAAESMRAAVQAKREMVGYLTITAPFDGMITERDVSPGALVGPDDVAKARPMFVLENNRTLRLTVAVPEVYSGEVHAKASIEFTVSALPEKVFTAKLSRSSGALEQGLRAMIAEFDVPNSTNTLKTGMYADVKLPIKRDAATLFVPTSAVVNSTERTFVIVVRDGTTAWVNVKKGVVVDSLTEVFGNLTAQDYVIERASEEMKAGKAVVAVQ